jgi:hypothetical protein
LEADAAAAEITDTNTIIHKDMIAQWKIQEVVALDGWYNVKETYSSRVFISQMVWFYYPAPIIYKWIRVLT